MATKLLDGTIIIEERFSFIGPQTACDAARYVHTFWPEVQCWLEEYRDNWVMGIRGEESQVRAITEHIIPGWTKV